MHTRIHSAFTDKGHAIYQAGYRPSDISNISVNDMSGSFMTSPPCARKSADAASRCALLKN